MQGDTIGVTLDLDGGVLSFSKVRVSLTTLVQHTNGGVLSFSKVRVSRYTTITH
jgi:hypothetical protein